MRVNLPERWNQRGDKHERDEHSASVRGDGSRVSSADFPLGGRAAELDSTEMEFDMSRGCFKYFDSQGEAKAARTRCAREPSWLP